LRNINWTAKSLRAFKKLIRKNPQLRPRLPESNKTFTARQLLNSGLIGVWENRTDIKDSLTYARQLRDQS
jgi:hypothetical protein